MLINSIICADCDEAMTIYELHDFYCADSKLVLQVEERVCLHCSSSVWQLVNLSEASQGLQIGRSESLEITLTSEREDRQISKTRLNKLMQLYFYEKFKNICFEKKAHVWYKKYEIELWENVIGISNTLSLSKEQILALASISKGLDMWIIDPQDWLGFEKQNLPFMQLRAWERLYHNRHKLFKPLINEQSQHAGKPSADAEP